MPQCDGPDGARRARGGNGRGQSRPGSNGWRDLVRHFDGKPETQEGSGRLITGKARLPAKSL